MNNDLPHVYFGSHHWPESFKLNSAMKQMWVDGLCSGKYQPGKILLHSAGQYCPLGVLADLIGRLDNEHFIPSSGEDGGRSFLSSSAGYELLPAGCQGLISYMNDFEKKSFSDIADWICANL